MYRSWSLFSFHTELALLFACNFASTILRGLFLSGYSSSNPSLTRLAGGQCVNHMYNDALIQIAMNIYQIIHNLTLTKPVKIPNTGTLFGV